MPGATAGSPRQQERLAASASEMKSSRDSVINKGVDYLGQILARDLFGNDAQATRPFEDNLSALGFGNLIMGERWDFPYTRPGNSTVFNVLADAWLADIEPVDSNGDGAWDIWRHISNVHPQGKFVSLGKFFVGGSVNGGAFYSDLTIGGGNADPYSLDTYTNANGLDPFVYYEQMGRQFLGEADDATVTWADRILGCDTDGDGRIDARWTELPDVFGLPKEMRIFTGVRIIDASAMFNVNANFELGASTSDENSPKVGLGRTPADVDLYTYLFDGFQTWGGPNDDNIFVNGSTPGRLGFKQHIYQTGIQDAILNSDFNFNARSSRVERENFWNRYARSAYRPGASLSPYGIADEMELRTFMFTMNDRAISRLEQNFDGLNFDPGDYQTWYNPLRSRMNLNGGSDLNWWEKVDFAAGTPTDVALQRDFRHLLTTYNGSTPIRPWSRGYSASDSPSVSFNLNSLLASNDPSTPQTLAGGFMWALAPYATDIGNPDGTDSGLNLYGSPVAWMPTVNNEQLHYGDGDAGYALLKAAMLAVNTLDAFDSGDPSDAESKPTIRTLRFNRNLSAPDRGDREIVGTFEHGKVPLQMTGPSGSQNDATITLIGMERQPFIREVSAVNVYGQLNDNQADQAWNYDPVEGNEEEWMVKILAVELGNPWPNAIDVGGYVIKYGDDALNSWTIPALTIPAGGTAVVYIGSDNPGGQANGVNAWAAAVSGRGAGQVMRIGDDSTHLEFEGGGAKYDEVTLWRSAPYGGIPKDILVDRIRPATSNSDFPNIISQAGENIPAPGNVVNETEFAVRVGSIRRYCDNPGGGMPGYFFESPVAIATKGRESASVVDRMAGNFNVVPPNVLTGAMTPQVEYMNDPTDAKGYLTPIEFAPFELQVADLDSNSDASDKDFRSSVDLLMVSTIGTLHCQQVNGTDPNFADKHLYVTASELLGDETLRGRMSSELSNAGVPNVPVLLDIIRPAGPSAVFPADFRFQNLAGNPNRFVGRLDFTRFIPRDANGAMITGALPLATRVVDTFDTVTVDGNVPLAQGRININTAPRRVLEALPFLHPRYAAGPIPARRPDLRIAESLRAYRDRGSFDMQSVDWSSGTRAAVSNLLVGATSGLRDDATSRGLGANDHLPGFTSLGELLLATKWTLYNSGGSYKVDPNVLVDESAYRTGHDTGNLDYAALDPNGFNIDSGWRTADFDPTDDPSEHLALIRAIRSSVSTRSDVFVAYITLVGFTPDDINRAEEPGGTVVQKLTRLSATMEQRYVVVFDRSGVKSPSDRPRVLFAAQEVPSR